MKLLYKRFLSLLMVLCVILIGTKAFAQQAISGKVVDAAGQPVAGAAVMIEGTTIGTMTDNGGNFTIHADSGSPLVVSIIGYKEVHAKLQNGMTIALEEDAELLQETVVVGYGTQNKATLTGAVAAIKSDEIIATKNENIANMLAGKVPGFRVLQRTGEPGALNASFDIRGMGTPLIVIDGVPSTTTDFTRLDGNEIDNISILKDASAAVYGVRAANGVVLITTKKGRSGKATFNYNNTFSVQTPTMEPDLMNASEFMTIYNEQQRNETPFVGGTNAYSSDDISAYANGTNKSYNWYGIAMDEHAPMQQHNISARGGSDKINYFVNVGYLKQDGIATSGIQKYDRWNIRSNFEAKLLDDLTINVNLSGMKDYSKGPSRGGLGTIYKSMWRQLPLNNPFVNDDPSKPFNGYDSIHPAVELDEDLRGYQKTKYGKFSGTGSLTYDFPWVQGLSAKALYSYSYWFTEQRTFSKEYILYNGDGTPVPSSNPNISKLTRSYTPLTNQLSQVSLNYQNRFGDNDVKALLLYETSKTTSDNFWVAREFSLDVLDELFAGNSSNITGNSESGDIYTNVNKGLVGRVNYSYKDKYLAEFSFRYDGSSKFMSGHQWGFFPAASVGWRVMEESFMKESPIYNVLTNLKLRASWGRTGDDSASSYQWLSGYKYPSTTNTVWNREHVTGAGTTGVPNEEITWYTADMLNIGFDANLWYDLLGITFEWFRRDRDGLLATRAVSVPGVFGASFSQENLNSDMTTGWEINLTHKNDIEGFHYEIAANLTYSRSKNKYQERAASIDSYDNWLNNSNDRWADIYWGYTYDGRFNSFDEIYNYSHYATGTNFYGNQNIVPGDIKIKDWNGDGVIDGNDYHVIGQYNTIPIWNYGATINMAFKGFDLNVLFQGGSGNIFEFKEKFLYALPWSGQSNGMSRFMDRWHTADDTANPFDPNTKWISGDWPSNRITNTINYSYNSWFNNKKVNYLRLKSIEIGYSLPEKLLSKVNIQRLRVFVNAYNLCTWSNLDGVDPERPSTNPWSSHSYVYPLMKTYSFGVDLTF